MSITLISVAVCSLVLLLGLVLWLRARELPTHSPWPPSPWPPPPAREEAPDVVADHDVVELADNEIVVLDEEETPVTAARRRLRLCRHHRFTLAGHHTINDLVQLDPEICPRCRSVDPDKLFTRRLTVIGCSSCMTEVRDA